MGYEEGKKVKLTTNVGGNDLLFIYLFIYLGGLSNDGLIEGCNESGYSESVVDNTYIQCTCSALYEHMWDNEDIYHSDLITDVYTHVNKTFY